MPPHGLSADELRVDLARRLRPVCEHWPEPEFARLVECIVAVELKYGGRHTPYRGTPAVVE